MGHNFWFKHVVPDETTQYQWRTLIGQRIVHLFPVEMRQTYVGLKQWVGFQALCDVTKLVCRRHLLKSDFQWAQGKFTHLQNGCVCQTLHIHLSTQLSSTFQLEEQEKTFFFMWWRTLKTYERSWYLTDDRKCLFFSNKTRTVCTK